MPERNKISSTVQRNAIANSNRDAPFPAETERIPTYKVNGLRYNLMSSGDGLIHTLPLVLRLSLQSVNDDSNFRGEWGNKIKSVDRRAGLPRLRI